MLLHMRREHRKLHSFPTRRSSDLSRTLVLSREQRIEQLSCLGQFAPNVFECGLDFRLQHARWRAAHSKTFGDRKSTRLNSSHVSISYAVFCLKKKILNN